jgi:hypothetical protein
LLWEEPIQLAAGQAAHKLNEIAFHRHPNPVVPDPNAVEVARPAQLLQLADLRQRGRALDLLNRLPDASRESLGL